MELRDFIAALRENAKKRLGFRLPNGQLIPSHFHITEIGKSTKDFIDCGGTRRLVESCLLQTLVAKDVEHQLMTDKLLGIVEKASVLGLAEDSPVEAEVQIETISIFSVVSPKSTDTELVFGLAPKRTACLAPSACGTGLDSLPVLGGGGCCSSDEDCC